jgi:hypothetical protein
MDEDLVSITGGPLRAHEYVLVKPEPDFDDEVWINNHAAKTSGDRSDPTITLLIGATQKATMQRVIKGWNITRPVKQPDGNVVEVPFPFTTENIGRLPGRISRYLIRKYAEMNPDEEESDADFLPVVVDSSEDNLNSERVVRLKR